MAEMEDKFQEILGNEAAMSQIMSLAQSFGGETETQTETGAGFETMLGSLDPKMMALGMKLMSAYQSGHRTIDLMTALRPFVSEQRHELMDRMATATKLARVATCVFGMVGEKEESHV